MGGGIAIEAWKTGPLKKAYALRQHRNDCQCDSILRELRELPMYWWNVDALAADLKDNNVSDLSQLKYLLAWLILQIVSYAPNYIEGHPAQPLLRAMFLLCLQLVLILGGTIVCWRANLRGDNHNFLARFICITWPISVRVFSYFTAVVMGAAAVLGIVLGILGKGSDLEETIASVPWYYFLLLYIVPVFVYAWARQALLNISGARQSKPVLGD
jgi:hypothetical protein